jgi:cobalt-zinc-cadmium efflux system protein
MTDGHKHHVVSVKQENRLMAVLVITGIVMLVEVIGGLVSGSLALLADAGHMFTDVAALFLSWGAARLSRRTPDDARSFGYARLKILAAYTNAILLFVIVLFILFEAVDRFADPQPINSSLMMLIAFIGLAANAAGFFILKGNDEHAHDHHGHDHSHEHPHAHGHDLNTKSAILHIISDMAGSVAAIGAAIIIAFTGWNLIDPILSVGISLLIAFYAIGLTRKTLHILLEGTPDKALPGKIRASILTNVPGVTDVRHIHVWSLTEQEPLATLEAVIDSSTDHQTALSAIKALLEKQFHMDHVTVQIERH